jgi:hypothetical protein
MHFLTRVFFASHSTASEKNYRKRKMVGPRTACSNKSGQGKARSKGHGTTIQLCKNNTDIDRKNEMKQNTKLA